MEAKRVGVWDIRNEGFCIDGGRGGNIFLGIFCGHFVVVSCVDKTQSPDRTTRSLYIGRVR